MGKWIRENLFVKLFLAILLAASLLSLVIYGIVILYLPASYSQRESERFETGLEQLARLVENRRLEEIQADLDLFAVANKAVVQVLEGESADSVLAEADYHEFTFHIDENNAVSATPAEPISGPYTYVFAQELAVQGQNSLVLLCGTLTVDAASEISGTLVSLLPWVALLAVVVSALSAALISRHFTRPIRNISAVSQKLAQLDMTWRCEMSRQDEVGQLATSIDRMAMNLETALFELEQANNRLQRAMASQRDFFAAVSHELKTPITVLRGQLESMIYGIGAYKDVRASLPETLETVDGMQKLVAEILTISKLNMAGYALQPEEKNMRLLIQKCIEEYHPLVTAKNIRLQTDLAPGVRWAVDATYFPKALSNVLNNAITYSPENATISVILTDDTLRVQNTGVTLQNPDMVFDPFHREESSGSRETGGSGLGLYMVKTILELHKMHFSIRNAEDAVVFEICHKVSMPGSTENKGVD